MVSCNRLHVVKTVQDVVEKKTQVLTIKLTTSTFLCAGKQARCEKAQKMSRAAETLATHKIGDKCKGNMSTSDILGIS